jgi:hypothetical protein
MEDGEMLIEAPHRYYRNVRLPKPREAKERTAGWLSSRDRAGTTLLFGAAFAAAGLLEVFIRIISVPTVSVEAGFVR